jgi:hypothetical protein
VTTTRPSDIDIALVDRGPDLFGSNLFSSVAVVVFL